MKDLVDTTEMYLRTIYELEEEGVTPLRARIAERLEQSGPTVSQTVARMERDGLVVVTADRSLQMTEKGRERATSVMRKHRLAELLLTDILGMDIQNVHAEACRWEHVMSTDVERCLVEKLDNISRSPFGNPIPGLDQLGVAASDAQPGKRVIDFPEDTTVSAKVVQINEILQVDEKQFNTLSAAGIKVGSVIEVSHRGGVVTLVGENATVELEDDLGHAIRVEKVDS